MSIVNKVLFLAVILNLLGQYIVRVLSFSSSINAVVKTCDPAFNLHKTPTTRATLLLWGLFTFAERAKQSSL